MSFEDLAVAIGHKPPLMGRRVGAAWHYYAEQKDCGACSVIAAAFYPKNNPKGTCIANPW